MQSAPRSERLSHIPLLRELRDKMKDPKGLVILGEALGNNPSDSLAVGNEAFVADRLRGVTDIITADFRKIARLPGKLKSGVEVAWALLVKTLPARMVHLLRAHPMEHMAELAEILQGGPHDTVRVHGRPPQLPSSPK